jgi:hypothetical protein
MNPGTGYLHYNNSNLSVVDKIWINNNDINNISQLSWITSFDDSNTLSARGYLTIATQTINNIFLITGPVVNKGLYYEIPVQFISGLTRADQDSIVTVNFSRTGNSGTSGTSGTSGGSGAQGNKGGLQYDFSTGTSLTSPFPISSGTWRANTSSPSLLFIHQNGIEGSSHKNFIDTWDDSNSTEKGILIITGNSNSSTSYLICQINSITYNGTSAYTISVTYLSGTLPSGGTACSVQFYRTGNSGASAAADIKLYTNGSTSWTKPTNAKRVYGVVIGGGGGGGGGAKSSNTSNKDVTGGGGGGSGAIVRFDMSADILPSTVGVVVGAGGPGGAVQATNNTDGNPGTNGSPSMFGHIIASGGRRGAGGRQAQTIPANVTVDGGAGGGTAAAPNSISTTDYVHLYAHSYGGRGQGIFFTGVATGDNPYYQGLYDRIYGTTGGGAGAFTTNANGIGAATTVLGANGAGVLVTNTSATDTTVNWPSIISSDIITGFNSTTNYKYGSVANTNVKSQGGLFYSGSGVNIGLGGSGGAIRGLNVTGGEGGDGGSYGGGGGGAGPNINDNGTGNGGKGGAGGSGCVLVITT